MKTHGMAPTIPAVEVAHHAYAPSARRPHQEGDTGHTVEYDTVRAKFFVGAVVGALGQEVTVEVAQQRGESIGVVDLGDMAVTRHLEPIGKRLTPVGQHCLEEPRGVQPLHRGRGLAGGQDADGSSPRHHRANGDGRAKRRLHTMWTEYSEGVAMLAFDERANRVRVERHGCRGAVAATVCTP